MSVKIVCDSTTYLTREQISDFGIKEVSLSVVWGDESVPELSITDLDSFYDELREMKNLPTTSQPSVGEFLEVYRPIIEAGDDIVSTHFSSGISGTYDSASQAKQQLVREGVGSSRISVIDTGSACGGYGLIALAAASCARSGGNHADVLQKVYEMTERLSFWFAVDTLEYLRRGGRIGAVANAVGTAIQIKPILTVTQEGIMPVERVRTESRVLSRIIDLGVQHIPEGGGFIVQHVQAPDRAQKVIDGLTERLGYGPVIMPGEIGPVIGAHVGPGLIGVGVYPPGLIYQS
ncbi:MAG: DegV family protein [Solirubrobacterales bacterium]